MLGAWREVPQAVEHHNLLPRGALSVEDGRVLFLSENEGVCFWATEPDGDDPRVWYAEDESGPWLEEPERLSGFLIQMVLFEAVAHASFGASAHMDDPTRDRILARVDPLPLRAWRWGGARFYARRGGLVMTMTEECDPWVWLAATTPLALSPFEDVVGRGWDHVAF